MDDAQSEIVSEWRHVSSVEETDLDFDGAPDRIERGLADFGGSGYHTARTCIRLTRGHHAACIDEQRTAYSPFSARTVAYATPPQDNEAVGRVPVASCRPLSVDDPAQGALMLLALPTPRDGVYDPEPLTWRAGRPAHPSTVCMTAGEAARFRGGLAWNASGEDVPWVTVVFAAPRDPPTRRTTVGPFEVLEVGNALALYDAELDQHTWIASWNDGSEDGFKIDRWKRIESIGAGAPGTIDVSVAMEGVVRIALPPQPPVR